MRLGLGYFQVTTIAVSVAGLALLVACSGDASLVEEGSGGTGQVPWVHERVRALEDIYNFTPEGRLWLEGYDLRQMVGQPGWFGSLGYNRWAGVGQAIPHSIVHEISHSYWGAFAVTGLEHLSWEVSRDSDMSPALQQYREDLETFMGQPPDSFEALRDRFRNLPNLSRGNYPDLFHHGEADLIYSVGGNLNLIPPILRKYFDHFLQPGDHQTWQEAIRWYAGLSRENRRWADQYFGITHLPLNKYEGLGRDGSATVPPHIVGALGQEERQRLEDFVEQFDLAKENELSFTDAASVDRGFQFWRGYLRGNFALYRRYPDVLENTGTANGREIREALDAIAMGGELSREDQVDFYRTQLREKAFLMNFAVLLPSRVLVELFGDEASAEGEEPINAVVTRFSQKLKSYVAGIESALEGGETNPVLGALRLEEFLEGLSEEQRRSDLNLIMDLLRDTDGEMAVRIVGALRNETLSKLHRERPSAIMNNMVQPLRLLDALNVRVEAPHQEVAEGISLLLEYNSGNFKIAEPYNLLAYEVVAERARTSPRDALALFEIVDFPLLTFVEEHTAAARDVLLFDTERSARLIAGLEGHRTTPQGMIHRMVFFDPQLAAVLVKQLEDLGREDIVMESLVVFAFDARRIRENPSLQISIENDRSCVEHLIDLMGKSRVESLIKRAVDKYQIQVNAGRIDPQFVSAYRETLELILDGEGVSRVFDQ